MTELGRTGGMALLALGLAVAALLVGTMLQPATAIASASQPRAWSWVPGEPTTLSLVADPGEVRYGSATTLTGQLTDPATGSGLAGAAVHLESRDPAGTWVELSTLSTDAAGAVSQAVTPPSASVYRLRHGEPGTTEASVSPEVTVTVRAVLTAAASRTTVRAGRPVQVTGTLAPAAGPVRLQRLTSGRWRTVATTSPAADGTFGFTVTPTTPGWWRWRVVRNDSPAGRGATVRLPAVNAVRMHTYSVTTRGTIRADLAVFRSVVAATYRDPRGWLGAHHGFREVRRGGAFTVVLSEARYLPSYSRVCSTRYSCRVGRYVIINQDRWRRGSPYFPGGLRTYRQMVVNHETGHWLGRGHAYCSGPGALAPVMQQQSKGMHGCRPNPWPLPREIRAVS